MGRAGKRRSAKKQKRMKSKNKKSAKRKSQSGQKKKRTKKSKKRSKKSRKNNKKKSKKEMKKKRKTKQRKGNRRSGKARQATAATCGVLVAQLGQNLPKALSWIQQGNRLNSNIKNKANKKDDFNAQYESGLATAGGDKAAPKCNGVAIGSKSNFSVALDALKNCSASIKASCEVYAPADLEAKVKACNDASEKYRVDFRQKLVKATEGTICANAATLNASWVAVEKACSVDVDVAKEEAAQLEQKKTCQKAFGECRKQERALPAEMNTCMPKC